MKTSNSSFRKLSLLMEKLLQSMIPSTHTREAVKLKHTKPENPSSTWSWQKWWQTRIPLSFYLTLRQWLTPPKSVSWAQEHPGHKNPFHQWQQFIGFLTLIPSSHKGIRMIRVSFYSECVFSSNLPRPTPQNSSKWKWKERQHSGHLHSCG